MSSTSPPNALDVQAELKKLVKQVADMKLIKQGIFKETVNVKSNRVVC